LTFFIFSLNLLLQYLSVSLSLDHTVVMIILTRIDVVYGYKMKFQAAHNQENKHQTVDF